MNKVGVYWAATLLFACVTSRGSLAASFDCGKAGRLSERTICSDPVLSSADAKLGAAFKAALGRLSQGGRAAIARDQRAWLGYRDKLCSVKQSTFGEIEKSPAKCLLDEIASRTALLSREGRHLGPYVMMSLGSYALRRYRPNPEEPWDTGLNVETARWPRIDRPGTIRTARWNRWIESKLKPDNENALSDNSVAQIETVFRLDRDITLPVDHLISTVIAYNTYSGGAHGNEYMTTYSYRIDEGRELAPKDIFALEKSWTKTLREQSFALLKIQLPDTFTQPADKDSDELVSDLRAWTVGGQGLSIRFREYSVAPYSDGIPEIVIPWRQLDDVLSPSSVMPIR